MAEQFDRNLLDWSRQRREEIGEVLSHECWGRRFAGAKEPEEGFYGHSFAVTDSVHGRRAVKIDFRPCLPGYVEFNVAMTTQKPGAKPQSRTLNLHAEPGAIRAFAEQLMEVADLTEARTPGLI
jgi:hypothetical protein